MIKFFKFKDILHSVSEYLKLFFLKTSAAFLQWAGSGNERLIFLYSSLTAVNNWEKIPLLR